MCAICGCPSWQPCNCNSNPSCLGCPIQLDFSCAIYHKDNNSISGISEGLGLTNGATLQLVVETIDVKLRQLKIDQFSLPCLRSKYEFVNTLQQFVQAVDTELCLLKVFRGNLSSEPTTPQDGWYWFNTTDPSKLHIQLNGATYTIPITAL